MIGTLRLNSGGPEVTSLQRDLRRAGYRMSEDGHFGHATEAAVRLFQKRHALLPDGIAGQATLRALSLPNASSGTVGTTAGTATTSGWTPFVAASDVAGALVDLGTAVGGAVVPWAMAALYEMANPNVSWPPKMLSMSAAGTAFLYSLEAQKGVSNHLYWPTGASGVTLGAGYDMRDRDAATIKADMLKIGLTPQTAEAASKGAGKTGLMDAEIFARKNHATISLTPTQETALLTLILPTYEKIVKRHVTVNLLQHEFDALVSFAYNPGGEFADVSRLINIGKIAQAMAIMKKRVSSAGKILPALVRRRNDEVNVYLYGKYVRT